MYIIRMSDINFSNETEVPIEPPVDMPQLTPQYTNLNHPLNPYYYEESDLYQCFDVNQEYTS